jgi:di/tripeptidase
MMGGVSSFKKIKVKHSTSDIILVFMDVNNFIEGGSLADFVKTFENGESKGMFPYEAFNFDNYEEYLNSTEPSPIKDFDSFLRRTEATIDDYKSKIAKSKISNELLTRWGHIEYYNKNDVEIMVPSVIELIKFAFEDKAGMLQNFSLFSVSIQKRYASSYEDSNIDNDYE